MFDGAPLHALLPRADLSRTSDPMTYAAGFLPLRKKLMSLMVFLPRVTPRGFQGPLTEIRFLNASCSVVVGPCSVGPPPECEAFSLYEGLLRCLPNILELCRPDRLIAYEITICNLRDTLCPGSGFTHPLRMWNRFPPTECLAWARIRYHLFPEVWSPLTSPFYFIVINTFASFFFFLSRSFSSFVSACVRFFCACR